jgi:hypothetical protein
MAYKMGKTPARAGAIKLAFASFFSAPDLPTPPLIFGRPGLIKEWKLFANDRISDCVWAGAAHETMLWRAWAGAPVPTFTDQNVISDYAKATGYDGTEASDQGTDMQAAAAYRKQVGVVDDSGTRHQIDAYVSLRPGNLDELALAAFLFGAVGVGVEMPSSAQDQFENAEPWTPVKGSPNEGGHYFPLFGRNSHGNYLVVSWGRLHACTPEFLLEQMDEGVAYLSLEMLKNEISPRGVDLEALKANLTSL